MLNKLELEIEYHHNEKLTYQISSLMHGIMMELIDPEYADLLHRDGIKPYHQYVSKIIENSFVWTICTLNKEAKEKILDVLMCAKKLYMKHKNLELKIVRWNLSGTTYDELIEKYYFQSNIRDITFQFCTPTAFKRNGQYVILPEAKLIFQSIINKYDTNSNDTKVGGEEIIEHFEKYTFIKKYQLRSVSFAMEGNRIAAFMGELTIHINGPEQMVNLAHMLAEYAQYSGIGIKCALGMGSVKTRGGIK